MADDTETIDPAAATADTQPDAVEPAPVATVDPAPSPSPSPAVSQPPKWALERIAEERRKGEEAVAAARQGREEAERRAAELQAIVERLQQKPADPNAPPAPPQPRDPATGRFQSPDQPKDWNAAVDAAAEQKVFIAECAAVGQLGVGEFTGRDGKQSWNDVLGVLQATGANADDCLKDVLAVDRANAHKLLAHLAEDGERAARFAKLPSRQRIVELTKMSQTITQPAATTPAAATPSAPTSKAPAPKPVLSPASPAPDIDPTTSEGNDKMDDAAWERWYKKSIGAGVRPRVAG